MRTTPNLNGNAIFSVSNHQTKSVNKNVIEIQGVIPLLVEMGDLQGLNLVQIRPKSGRECVT